MNSPDPLVFGGTQPFGLASFGPNSPTAKTIAAAIAAGSKSTLLLDNSYWDLVLDSNGNIAVAAPPYAVAQDVASAIKTFEGEVYYDTTLGVPYFQQILGMTPPLSVFQADMVAAALTVPSVQSAVCTIQSFQGREIKGQVQFTTSAGQTGSVTI